MKKQFGNLFDEWLKEASAIDENGSTITPHHHIALCELSGPYDIDIYEYLCHHLRPFIVQLAKEHPVLEIVTYFLLPSGEKEVNHDTY